ncbi:hypothetical protein RHSIM_Rhsim03G0125500 [Rhododendron simsii]|uniref:Uncharacterized protein n=1 Tax=Rhododendron simsii TaxID=118357 RepID=A0A834H9Y8_RHOSS|nr:hypothetical protein RHSIM_Rhsim03G0125500 [Rhododendron simsii]
MLELSQLRLLLWLLIRQPEGPKSGGANDGLEEDIPGGYKSEEVAELDAEVGKGPAGGGDLDDELSVAEDGEESREAGDDIGEGDNGAGVVVGFPASDDEDAGAEGELGEVAPGEAAVHRVLTVGSEGGELGGVGGAGGEAVAEAGEGLGDSEYVAVMRCQVANATFKFMAVNSVVPVA